jgi:hypothetical protein
VLTAPREAPCQLKIRLELLHRAARSKRRLEEDAIGAIAAGCAADVGPLLVLVAAISYGASKIKTNMRDRNTPEPKRSSSERRESFDEKKLERDVAFVISRLFVDGEEFIGHDGRQYAIVAVNEEEAESESFINVMVKLDNGYEVSVKYVILLQQISR